MGRAVTVRIKQAATILIVAATAGLAAPAGAQDVQAGIAAWQAGDYAKAVQEWRPLADSGNADAQFNLAQAYRLGRGLPQNLALAEQWFERAARQRHEQAGASLGLLLFQNGRARDAMPWLQAAAQRGDPRAQYVFGTALFNGDVVRRDLPRAYAMMRAAAAQGFPQAQAQLTEMDRQLTPEDRARSEQLAADLVVPPADPAPTRVAVAEPARTPPPSTAARPGTSYAPPPEQGPPTRIPPPNAGGQRPGVSYPIPPEDGRPVVAEERPQARPADRPAPAAQTPRPRPERPAVAERRDPPAPRPAPTPAPRPAAGGGAWQVQLGAFSSEANARRQWEQLRRRISALGGLSVAYPRAGDVVRVRAGGFANRDAADRTCASVRAAGAACIPVR